MIIHISYVENVVRYMTALKCFDHSSGRNILIISREIQMLIPWYNLYDPHGSSLCPSRE